MMNCRILAVDRVVLDAPAERVRAKTPVGWLGILPRHAPGAFALEDAPLEVVTEDGHRRFHVHEGVLHVRPDGVLLLADVVEPIDA